MAAHISADAHTHTHTHTVRLFTGGESTLFSCDS